MKKITIKKHKRRFKTEKEILDRIDDCYKRAVVLREKAVAKDAEADDMRATIKEDTSPHTREHIRNQIHFCRQQANKLRVKATRLTENRAKALGEKLSEFRTAIIPQVITDKTIAAL